MKSILALLATAVLLTTACGTESPVDSADSGDPLTNAAAASDDQELACGDQREELVADFDTDPDGGYETPEIALRRHVEYESRNNEWPASEDFEKKASDPNESEFVIFEYVQDDRRLAVAWARDLGRSWLVTAHAICKEVLG